MPNNQSKIVFRLNKPLAVDTDYFIAVKEGLRSKAGISIGKNNTTNKPLGWKFITGSQVCEVNKVSVQPAQLYFTKANVSAMLTASAYHNNDVLQSIPGSYAWEYVWQPTNTPQVIVSSTTSTVNTAVSQNRNGEADLRASAKIVENIYSAQTGIVASGNTHVIVFLCENPWPPKDLYVNGNGPFTIFPYEDKVGNNDGFNLQANIFDNSSIPPSPAGGYFNFRTYYCADNGRGGNTSDDLPYLYPAVQTAANIVADSPTSSLKRFIFTNNKNKDAIGIQIFSNPKHLTITDWFAADKALGGQGFTGDMTATKIDGYDAITDGNNIYVDALNYSDTSHNLFSNIYLFSINADADSETQRVFQQLLGNLKLNTNLTNYGYCGVDMNTPGVSTTCRTDFDCQNNEVCSVQTDKLKRNYQRLRDLKEIQDLFNP